jgi:AdoMet-dependent rRNA methyltransferase SPB1
VNSTTTTDVENENKEDEDDRMLNEMEELTYAMERKKKREHKLLAKRRAKVWCEVIITTSLAVIPCP